VVTVSDQEAFDIDRFERALVYAFENKVPLYIRWLDGREFESRVEELHHLDRNE
jgi:hypothetical protein